MLKIRRLCLIYLSILLFSAILSSCTNGKKSNVSGYGLPEKLNTLKTGVVAQNNRFTFLWDDAVKCILLYEKETGKVWSSTPYEYYSSGNVSEGIAKVNMFSPIIVTYIEASQMLKKTVTAYVGAIQNGQVTCRRISNGIKVVYYFDQEEITIPVEYILKEDGLEAKIVVNELQENKNKIYQISILPYLSAAKNNTDSYLFIPSGSGAIMYTDDINRKARTYSEMVYGNDAAVREMYGGSAKKDVRLPVSELKVISTDY